MPCRKSFTFSGACPLNTCATEANRAEVGTDIVDDTSLAFAPDLCYAAFLARNAADTQTYVYRYDPATNSAIKKATLAGNKLAQSGMVYDAAHQKFVWANNGIVYLFDPQTDVVSTFSIGLGASSFVYVPQRTKIYGMIGSDGLGQVYVGYVDLDLQIAVQLGVLPFGFGGSHVVPYNFAYVPSTDSLYGCWITGLGANMARFNLTTNVGTSGIVAAGIEGGEICLDTDRNLLIVHFGHAKEVNPVTGVIEFNGPIPAPMASISWFPYYSNTLKKVFGVGWDDVENLSIYSYNTQDKSTAKLFDSTVTNDYYSICKFSQGSCFANDATLDLSQDGVRRLCLT